jgi:pimeloyl-ACP methyl ester carboxylesterase
MKTGYLLRPDSGGTRHIHYTEWGRADAGRIVICVHGLTRNARDFDFLAQALSADFRVICPDVAGRGLSDWLPRREDYGYPVYCSDMSALISHVTAETPRPVYWVGTSMGGIIGMLLAARPGASISKLVVNDVGAVIPKAALERIGAYVGREPRLASLQQMEAALRITLAPFGALNDAQWRHLAEHSGRQQEDGSWAMHYDPAIGLPFRAGPIADVDLWSAWDAITCPTLVLRGAESDLLLKETAEAMTQRGPRPVLVEFAGVGHAPALMSDDQIEVVREFLLAPAGRG